MIELDLTPEQRRNSIIRHCGGIPCGEKPSSLDGRKSLVWFTDPITRSTCMLEVDDITIDKVAAKLKEKRDLFGLAVIERIAANYTDLRERIRETLRLCIAKYPVPEEVLLRAADNAFFELVNSIAEIDHAA